MMNNQKNADMVEVSKSALLNALGGKESLAKHVISALERDDMKSLQALMLIGADPNGLREDGSPLLIGLAERNRSEAIAFLIEAGADPNVKGNQGQGMTPLIWATHYKNIRVMETLIKAGARLDEKNNDGNTALTYAATYNRTGPMDILLNAGAKTDERNNLGQTARMIAEISGYHGIIGLLDKHEAGPAAHSAPLHKKFGGKAAGVADMASAANHETVLPPPHGLAFGS
jgi:ankyrin repeat protein